VSEVTIAGWVRDHMLQEGREWVSLHIKECEKAVGGPVNPQSFSRRIRETAQEFIEKSSVPSKAPRKPLQPDEEGYISIADLRTPEELAEHIDLDETKWFIKDFEQTAWGNAANPQFRMRVRYLPQVQPAVEDVVAHFKREVEGLAPPREHWPDINHQPEGLLLELMVPDLHLGQLSWQEETGQPYDLKIAVEMYKQAVKCLVARALSFGKVAKILIPLGNDYFNVDSENQTTTAGTTQSEDSRWQKSYMVGCELAVWVIDFCLATAPVDVVMVQGNHDWQRSWYLGEYLQAWYRNHEDVSIDNSPTPHKSYIFGQTLLGFTHKTDKKLPLFMATSWPDLWAATRYREWHTGHLHHEGSLEEAGVRVRWLPSIVARDDYHTKMLYGSLREAQEFLYDPEEGNIARFMYRPQEVLCCPNL
jgi:hypothetical protein